MSDAAVQWLALLVLGATAAGATVLLRRAAGEAGRALPTSAWAMLAGAAVGLLLGVTVLGRLLPDLHEQWCMGGVEERIDRDALLRRQIADTLASEHALLDVPQRLQLRMEQEQQLAIATQRWHMAQQRDQTLLRIVTACLAGLTLLAGSVQRSSRASASRDWAGRLSIGAWAAALPGGLAFIAATSWFELSWSSALMIASAVAIGPWILTVVDVDAAADAEIGGERLVHGAGRIATFLAFIAFSIVVLTIQPTHTMLLLMPCAIAVIGWVMPVPERIRAALIRSVEHVALPLLAALIVVRIDLQSDAAFWPVVIIALLCNDGRWCGGIIGAMLLGGRTFTRTARMVVGSMSAGVAQLCIAGLALQGGLLSPAWAIALVAGALLMDFTVPTRRRLVQQLGQIESEFDDATR